MKISTTRIPQDLNRAFQQVRRLTVFSEVMWTTERVDLMVDSCHAQIYILSLAIPRNLTHLNLVGLDGGAHVDEASENGASIKSDETGRVDGSTYP